MLTPTLLRFRRRDVRIQPDATLAPRLCPFCGERIPLHADQCADCERWSIADMRRTDDEDD